MSKTQSSMLLRRGVEQRTLLEAALTLATRALAAVR